MLSSFSVGTGAEVTISAGKTLIVISQSGHGSRYVTSYARINSTGYFVVPADALYTIVNGYGLMEFGDENGKLFSLDD